MMKESGISLNFNDSIILNIFTMPVKSLTHFSISQRTKMFCIVENISQKLYNTYTHININDSYEIKQLRTDWLTIRAIKFNVEIFGYTYIYNSIFEMDKAIPFRYFLFMY